VKEIWIEIYRTNDKLSLAPRLKKSSKNAVGVVVGKNTFIPKKLIILLLSHLDIEAGKHS